MRVVAILGSGFGLYGYLPAMVEAGASKIALPVRYQAKLSLRPELKIFSSAVQWVTDENAALEIADSVVLALRPDLQAQWVSRCMQLSNIKHLLLEKPLAPSPDDAVSLFEELVMSKKAFRIGYIFRFTSWGARLLRSMRGKKGGDSFDRLNINWNFLAHHFQHESTAWKKYRTSGGGAIRFYGVHLIALLAEIGYQEISSSQTFGPNTEEILQWTATFSGMGLPVCNVAINTKATSNQFRIDCAGGSTITTIVDQADPFYNGPSELSSNELDRRTPLLRDLCLSLWEDPGNIYKWYRDTLRLWRIIEERTFFKVITV